MESIEVNPQIIQKHLKRLLDIPSPSGYTDQVVRYVSKELERMEIHYELTRRGAIRADVPGKQKSPDRAIVVHLDTLGAMVRSLKENGRLSISPIGNWSARFAEGAKVTIFTDTERRRGTILPLKSSGHTFGKEIDQEPIGWDHIEVRVDQKVASKRELVEAGFHVGDFLAIDPEYEFNPNGFINSRHLDNKAGVATLLASLEAITNGVKSGKIAIPQECHFLFTIFEEVGSGASAVLHGDVAEMVSIDNATPAKGQNSIEDGVTVCMMDSSGPFDYHLTHKIINLCEKFQIKHARDVFRYYRTDAASAIEAGNDIRTSLICFGADSSHGYERTHMDSLVSLGNLINLYVQSESTFHRDKAQLSSIRGFSKQPLADKFK